MRTGTGGRWGLASVAKNRMPRPAASFCRSSSPTSPPRVCSALELQTEDTRPRQRGHLSTPARAEEGAPGEVPGELRLLREARGEGAPAPDSSGRSRHGTWGYVLAARSPRSRTPARTSSRCSSRKAMRSGRVGAGPRSASTSSTSSARRSAPPPAREPCSLEVSGERLALPLAGVARGSSCPRAKLDVSASRARSWSPQPSRQSVSEGLQPPLGENRHVPERYAVPSSALYTLGNAKTYSEPRAPVFRASTPRGATTARAAGRGRRSHGRPIFVAADPAKFLERERGGERMSDDDVQIYGGVAFG